MKQSESKEKFEAFVEVSKQLQRFLEARESPDEDYDIVGQTYNSLLAELLANLELFSKEQQKFIEESKIKTSLPKNRLARCRARSRSRSRSPSVTQQSLSSEESFASTSNNSTMGDEEVKTKMRLPKEPPMMKLQKGPLGPSPVPSSTQPLQVVEKVYLRLDCLSSSWSSPRKLTWRSWKR